MATQKSIINYLLCILSSLNKITAQKMFGEYAIYYDGKVVALVCDDELFIKPTKKGACFINKVIEKAPYPGAKLYYLISADMWENSDWLIKLILITAENL